MYKHLSCAAFKIKLTTGSGNAGTYEKLHDRSRIRLRQKAGVCASALTIKKTPETFYCFVNLRTRNRAFLRNVNARPSRSML